MQSIRVSNLRSIVDSGNILLRPITLFLGGNGAGKSSLLRLFPLLRQSVESRTKGPLLLFGDYVDYGDFHDMLRMDSNEKRIKLSLKLNLNAAVLNKYSKMYAPSRSFGNMIGDENLVVDVELSIFEGKREDSTRIGQLKLEFNSNIIKFVISKDGSKVETYVNDDETPIKVGNITTRKGQILPRFYEELEEQGEVYPRSMSWSSSSTLYKSIAKEVKSYMHWNIKNIAVSRVMRMLPINNIWDRLKDLLELPYAGIVWTKSLKKILDEKSGYPLFVKLNLAWFAFSLVDFCDEYLWRTARNILYINPLRATAERYYRPRDLALDQVDPRGQNLPMFLLNLGESDKNSLTQWSEKYFGFAPIITTSGGHVSIKIQDKKTSKTTNLADTGFGYSQVLPVIVQLWHATNSRRLRSESRRYGIPIIFAIEQPELHLHPHFQALLADAFVAAHKEARSNKIQLIILIETHSKTIINRFGHLIHNDRIESSDAALYLFEKRQDDLHSKISLSTFSNVGLLENWPYGFLEPGNV